MAATPVPVALVKNARDEETSTDSGCSEGSETGDWQGARPASLECASYADENTRLRVEDLRPLELPQYASDSPRKLQRVDFSETMRGAKALTPEQTLILFDWDDTILPSSWVTRLGLTLGDDSIISEEVSNKMYDFAQVALATLEVAQTMGTVVMVTNAETGWIELSCRKFMPSLLDEVLKLQHVSARSTYEPLGIASPSEWKILAFENEIAKFFGNEHSGVDDDLEVEPSCRSIRNIISMGDSAHERDAIMRATERSTHSRTKSLKMLERPEIEQLKEQHELITSFFPVIAQYDGHLDLCVKCA